MPARRSSLPPTPRSPPTSSGSRTAATCGLCRGPPPTRPRARTSSRPTSPPPPPSPRRPRGPAACAGSTRRCTASAGRRSPASSTPPATRGPSWSTSSCIRTRRSARCPSRTRRSRGPWISRSPRPGGRRRTSSSPMTRTPTASPWPSGRDRRGRLAASHGQRGRPAARCPRRARRGRHSRGLARVLARLLPRARRHRRAARAGLPRDAHRLQVDLPGAWHRLRLRGGSGLPRQPRDRAR